MMSGIRKVWAVVPVKETAQSKQRLAGVLPQAQRQELALAMAGDVLRALALVPQLDGILVVTADPAAADLAARYGARVSQEQAREGHTGAVVSAARRLAADGFDMLALPADIPLVEPQDIQQMLALHGPTPAFTIVPARDEQGSNAVLCSPADAVPLRFGEDSFFPHLAFARAHCIEPLVMHLSRIALDIDTPEDLALLLAAPPRTQARALLDRWDVGTCGLMPEFGQAAV